MKNYQLEYLEKQSTDNLVDIIVFELGLPLPCYNYEAKVFTFLVLKNIKIYPSEGVSGVTLKNEASSFRQACIELINSHDV